MDETLRELRRVLERGPAGRLGFPVEVRRGAAAWARLQRAAGEPVRSVAAQLGVSHETVRRWLKQGVGTFRGVRVTEVAAPPRASGSGVVLRLPNGVVVEGLGVHDMIIVLRALA